MIQYPISFQLKTVASGDFGSTWQIEGKDGNLACAIPTDFEGHGGAPSPEDLFCAALTNCFVATFKVYAYHSKVSFREVRCHSVLMVDLNEQKKPVMKTLVLQAKIMGASNPERAEMLAKKAFQSGFILNSVKTDTKLEIQMLD